MLKPRFSPQVSRLPAVRIFGAVVLLATCLPLQALRADSLFDESRLQSIVARQSAALVRVKAAVEDRELTTDKTTAAAKNSSQNDLQAKTLDAKSSAKAKASAKDSATQTGRNAKDSAKGADKTADEAKETKTFLRIGTGFFVSTDGLIITNASIVDGAQRVWYEVDGVSYLAEVKGIDIPTNIALLKAKTSPRSISPINLADSVTLPAVGSLLVRLSLPMDFGATPTVGIMQGADTQFGQHAFPTRYLRVQFNTGPGEAGAPVFDLQGHFAGVSVAVLPELEASYVLPARALSYVRENMTAAGRAYSYFGFNVDEENTAADGRRLVVKNVEDKGPAAAAGLKVGDVVTEASRKQASSLGDLRDAAFFTKPGQYLDLKVRRGSSETAIAVQAVERK